MRGRRNNHASVKDDLVRVDPKHATGDREGEAFGPFPGELGAELEPEALATMGLDLYGLLEHLASTRPIFHSEADFQHALAWQIQVENPAARVRLETRPQRGIHLDLFVRLSDERIAIELKYLVARFEGVVGGEVFDLPNQGAHDISRHDVVKDVVRVERLLATGLADSGWVIALSNDSNYWRPGTKVDPIDAMFRLHDGKSLSGVLQWNPRAGEGTTRGRDQPLPLQNVYTCGWSEYATVISAAGRAVPFRHLAFAVVPR